MKHHRIPNPPPITDAMTTNALGTGAHDLIGHTIVTTYEIPDSDRRELLLLLDNGRVIAISTDPGYADDTLTTRDPKRWQVVLYDATDTEAAEPLRKLEPGYWL